MLLTMQAMSQFFFLVLFAAHACTHAEQGLPGSIGHSSLIELLLLGFDAPSHCRLLHLVHASYLQKHICRCQRNPIVTFVGDTDCRCSSGRMPRCRSRGRQVMVVRSGVKEEVQQDLDDSAAQPQVCHTSHSACWYHSWLQQVMRCCLSADACQVEVVPLESCQHHGVLHLACCF